MRLRAEQPRLPARKGLRALFVCAAAALAFAVSMIVPARALAAIVPACEHDAVSMIPAVPLESSCDAAAEGDLDDTSGAAPICDEQGVSAVAPPRLHPIVDARIEAGHVCSSTSVGPSIGPQRGDHPVLHSPAIVNQATLGAPVVVRPALFVEMDDLSEIVGGPRIGFQHGIYHPPR